MIAFSVSSVEKWIDGFARRWFDTSGGRDLAPDGLPERMQPVGWGAAAYALAAIVLTLAIHVLTSNAVGTAHYALTVLALVLAIVALRYPALGMVLIIAAVLIMPPGTRIPGLGPVSPNLLFSAATVAGFLGHVVIAALRGRALLPWINLYVALLPMLGFHTAFALVGYGPRAWLFLQTFLQGVYPLVVTRTAMRQPSMLLAGLTCLVTVWTARSLFLLTRYSFNDCWNPYPHNSGGLGALRYGHTLYGDPATVLAWIANLMVGLSFGMFVFAKAWPSRLYFFFTFVVSMLIAWLSLARGGMLGSAIAVVVVSILAYQARRRASMMVGVATAIGIACFSGSCLPIVPHVAESLGIQVDQAAPAPAPFPDPRFSVWCQGINRYGGFCAADEIVDADDSGGLPNLLIGDGPGARRGYHSYVINSAVDYGLPFLALVLLMGTLILKNGVRLVCVSARGDHLVHGAAVGLFAGAVVASLQAVFDSTLRVVGYALIFWYLRGIETSLLAVLPVRERSWLARVPRLGLAWNARRTIGTTLLVVVGLSTVWILSLNVAFYVAVVREFGPELYQAITGNRLRFR